MEEYFCMRKMDQSGSVLFLPGVEMDQSGSVLFLPGVEMDQSGSAIVLNVGDQNLIFFKCPLPLRQPHFLTVRSPHHFFIYINFE
jgi:hypothetical protein